jgi:hypothetical protein
MKDNLLKVFCFFLPFIVVTIFLLFTLSEYTFRLIIFLWLCGVCGSGVYYLIKENF